MPLPPTVAIIPGGSGFLLIVLCLYLLPTVVAIRRAHHQLAAILIVDVFLGWTFVGWVVALAMAFTPVVAPPAD
jgi:T4 superinfection immunity protein